jgi:hypothetical protein
LDFLRQGFSHGSSGFDNVSGTDGRLRDRIAIVLLRSSVTARGFLLAPYPPTEKGEHAAIGFGALASGATSSKDPDDQQAHRGDCPEVIAPDKRTVVKPGRAGGAPILGTWRMTGGRQMAIRQDPEGNEARALFDLVDLDGREVLEIGCGDGRLTWRYADRAAHVTAVEPFGGALERARADMPSAVRGSVDLHRAAFADFASTWEPSRFDVAILSWSLC